MSALHAHACEKVTNTTLYHMFFRLLAPEVISCFQKLGIQKFCDPEVKKIKML